MQGTAKRVAKNTGILYTRMFVTLFISLYTTRLVLAALGAEDFGIFNVVAGAIAMLTFLNSAMAGATQRFISYAEGAGDKERIKTIFNVSLVLHLLIAAAVLLIFEVGGYFLFQVLKIPPDRMYTAQVIYQFMIVSTLFTIISVPYDAVINAHENMLLVAIMGVIESLFKLGIALYITYTASDKLFMYGLLTAISAITLLLINRIYCHRKYAECEINIRKYYKKGVFKEMTGFAGWTFLGSSSSMLANYGQGIVLNVFFGPVVNAAQGVSNQVSGQLGVFASLMMKAVNPVIGKSEGAGNRDFMLRTSMIGSKISTLLLIFFSIPVIIEMPFVLKIWLKNVPDYAVVFCQLFLIRNMIEQLFYTLVSSIAAHGAIKRYQITVSILRFFPLVISYFLFVIHMPPYSMYITFIIYSIIASGIILHYANVNLGLSTKTFFNEVIWKCVACAGAMLVLGYLPLLFMKDDFSRLIIVGAITTITFFVVVWLMALSDNEKNLIKNIFNSLVKKISFN